MNCEPVEQPDDPAPGDVSRQLGRLDGLGMNADERLRVFATPGEAGRAAHAVGVELGELRTRISEAEQALAWADYWITTHGIVPVHDSEDQAEAPHWQKLRRIVKASGLSYRTGDIR